MMVEVVGLGQPLSLYPLERNSGMLERGLTRLGLMSRLSPREDPNPAGGLGARLLAAIGKPVHSRDMTATSRLLIQSRLASWLGDPVIQPERGEDDSLTRVADRIRVLIGVRSGVRSGV